MKACVNDGTYGLIDGLPKQMQLLDSMRVMGKLTLKGRSKEVLSFFCTLCSRPCSQSIVTAHEAARLLIALW